MSIGNPVKRVAAAYRNSSQRIKILIVYVLVIVLPFSLFVYALLSASFERAYDAHLHREQQAMQQNIAGLSRRLAQIEGYAIMFQNDKRLVEYLSLQNQSVADEILSFRTELYPLFAYAYSLDSDITQLEIHFINKPLVPLPTHILYGEMYEETTQALPMGGEWTVSPQEADGAVSLLIQYRSPLYNTDYSRRLGYLVTDVRDQMLRSYLSQTTSEAHQYIAIADTWYLLSMGEIVPVLDGDAARYLARFEAVQAAHPDETNYLADGLLVNLQTIPELGVQYLTLVGEGTVASFRQFGGLLLIMLLCFAALSGLYYAFLSTFTSRLIRLSAHIKRTRYGHLVEFEDRGGDDEIGQVIHSHNTMIADIRKLVSDLNISRLKQDQAKYFALQAQIRPHFLYNALETARMMAESQDDEATADFIYNLGIFSRYSFTSFDSDVPLSRELDMVQKYLEIYKATMGNRLNYALDVDGSLLEMRCPPFLIQPLVENAIRHGAINGACLLITIRIYHAADTVYIEVSDNGPGIDPAKIAELLSDAVDAEFPTGLSEKGSVGIHNVRNRLMNYYGDRAGFTMTSAPGGGTRCTISLTDTQETE